MSASVRFLVTLCFLSGPALGQIEVTNCRSKAISTIDNATPRVVTLAVKHGLTTGDEVSLESIGGATELNGTHIVTVTSDTAFSLDGSSTGSAYTSGGVGYRVLNTLTFEYHPLGIGLERPCFRVDTPAAKAWTAVLDSGVENYFYVDDNYTVGTAAVCSDTDNCAGDDLEEINFEVRTWLPPVAGTYTGRTLTFSAAGETDFVVAITDKPGGLTTSVEWEWRENYPPASPVPTLIYPYDNVHAASRASKPTNPVVGESWVDAGTGERITFRRVSSLGMIYSSLTGTNPSGAHYLDTDLDVVDRKTGVLVEGTSPTGASQSIGWIDDDNLAYVNVGDPEIKRWTVSTTTSTALIDLAPLGFTGRPVNGGTSSPIQPDAFQCYWDEDDTGNIALVDLKTPQAWSTTYNEASRVDGYDPDFCLVTPVDDVSGLRWVMVNRGADRASFFSFDGTTFQFSHNWAEYSMLIPEPVGAVCPPDCADLGHSSAVKLEDGQVYIHGATQPGPAGTDYYHVFARVNAGTEALRLEQYGGGLTVGFQIGDTTKAYHTSGAHTAPIGLITLNHFNEVDSISTVDNSTPRRVTSVGTHGLTTGDRVSIGEVDPAELNGTWTVTVTDTTNFTLDGSSTGTAYVSGGEFADISDGAFDYGLFAVGGNPSNGLVRVKYLLTSFAHRSDTVESYWEHDFTASDPSGRFALGRTNLEVPSLTDGAAHEIHVFEVQLPAWTYPDRGVAIR